MDIDPDIANWILDFLVRQPLEERTLNSLLSALPLPNDNPNLQKILLLKKLESQLSRRSFSQTTLDLLEQLDGIEFRRGNEASDAMKFAYCLVAVDCTLRPLKHGDDGEDAGKFKFFETVKRVWRGRIGQIEKGTQKGDLGSEMLWAWKEEMEAAVWEDDVRHSVLKKFDGIIAEEAVRVYLNEEKDKMGPSFLELVAEKVRSEEGLRKIMGIEGINRVAEEEIPSRRVDQATNGSNGSKEMQKGKIKLRDKLVGVRRVRLTASGNSRGAKIVDSDEAEAEPSSGIHSILPRSAEVNKARESLYTSSMDLRAVVKDPLPDALRFADVLRDGERQDKCQEPAENSNAGPKMLVIDVNGVVQSGGGNANKVRKPSLMERNETAHAYEWDDSIDGSPDGIACRVTIQLPSPKRIKTSPLKLYEMKNVKKRRKGRRWSLEEEQTLREGVEKCGKGCWKQILVAYRDMFDGRTDVDLKDKWRNMTRY